MDNHLAGWIDDASQTRAVRLVTLASAPMNWPIALRAASFLLATGIGETRGQFLTPFTQPSQLALFLNLHSFHINFWNGI